MNPKKPPFAAEVKQHNGTPTLFVNGEPEFWTCMWSRTPGPDDDARQTGKLAGIHIYTPHTGSMDQWCGPGEGHSGHWERSGIMGHPLFENYNGDILLKVLQLHDQVYIL